MRKVALVILLRLALLVAIAASAALLVDYQHVGDPAFCGVGSGCLAVRLSPYSKLYGLPLPPLGLAAYVGLFILSLASWSREVLRVGVILNGLGALAACVLIYLQAFEIRAFCKWCVAVDASAIVAFIVAVLLYVEVETESQGGKDAEAEMQALAARLPISVAWVLAGAASIGAPFVWGQFPVIPPLPPEIVALQVPGKITIVSFTDFECPFCRALHPLIEEVAAPHPDRIVLVRRMMPLSGHRGAMPGALAYTCAPEAKRHQMVDALYGAPEHRLTREGTIDIAADLGLDRDELARCVDSPEARDQVDKDIKLFEDIHGQALPLTYVGPRAILGFSPDQVREAAELALQGDRLSLPVSWMLAALGVIFAAVAAVTLRFAPRR
jgi:uncharacterized membrane protein